MGVTLSVGDSGPVGVANLQGDEFGQALLVRHQVVLHLVSKQHADEKKHNIREGSAGGQHRY